MAEPESNQHLKSSAHTQAQLRKMERSFKKGQKLFVEGDPPGDMYILMAGILTVTSRGVHVATINSPGAYVGEMSVLLREPRTATVTAEEDCRVLCVQEKDILEFLTHAPDLALKLSRILAERLKHTNAAFTTYRREMSERVKYLSDRVYKVFLLSKNPSKSSLSEMNSIVRETVTYMAALKPLDEEKRGERIL
jgi:CRP-like cAMP-binding protein